MEFTNPQLARTIHESEKKIVVIPEKGNSFMIILHEGYIGQFD